MRNAHWLRPLLPVAALLFSSGCVPDESAPTGSIADPATIPSGNAQSGLSPSELVLQDVARSVALAMGNPQVRASVIRGMQGSPYNEHKLVLHSFLEGPGGGELRSSARDHGATDALLGQVVELFPDGLDVYVPNRSQRRSWTGSDRLLVAGVTDTDATEATAFDTEGNQHLISAVEVAGYDAVVVIHPAEPKVTRANNVPAGRTTIEGDLGVFGVDSGSTMNAVCNPEVSDCSNEPPPPPPPPPTPQTRVTRVFPDFDDGPFGGDLELYYVTENVNNPASVYESAIFDAEPYVLRSVNVKIFNAAASSSLELLAVLWEADGFPNGHDDWKGEPWPVNIKGGGDYASFDPFYQIFWAEYRVAVNQ